MALESLRERIRRQRRVWWIGLLLSAAVHLLLLLLFRSHPEPLSPDAAAGPRAGDPVAAAGGGGMRAVVIRPPEEITVPPRPEIPQPKPVEMEPREEPTLALSDLREPDLGEGEREGPETGRGLPGAEGGGDAGNAMEGRRRLLPPRPRGALFTPLSNRPQSVRGREVTVWVFVTEAGAVDSVRLEPPTSDSRFNEMLIRDARDWSFEPARRAGQAVAAWFSYTWEL